MDESLDEIEFLVSSDHRVGVLDALTEESCDRNELRSTTGASSPTMGRILADFEDRQWIERDGRTYRLTSLGEFLAEEFSKFRDSMAYQHQLREIWPWLPHEIEGFSIALFTDVIVSKPGPRFPYEPVERLTELITRADTMHGFGMALLKSGNLEALFDQIHNGLYCEYIYPPTVFEGLLSWDQEAVKETVKSSNYTVMLHDNLPLDERCGICLFDDRVSICCYDTTTGSLQSLVDTESDEMYDWAESYYEQFRDAARPLENSDLRLGS